MIEVAGRKGKWQSQFLGMVEKLRQSREMFDIGIDGSFNIWMANMYLQGNLDYLLIMMLFFLD